MGFAELRWDVVIVGNNRDRVSKGYGLRSVFPRSRVWRKSVQRPRRTILSMAEIEQPGMPTSASLGAVVVPAKPALEDLEKKWSKQWQADNTYTFDRTRPRAEVYSIDTPPPTVSGSLHVGHVFSYTHTDVIARFHRMRGKSVFYPMGWDDNGLATERRVQNHYGVRCDPSLAYDPTFEPPGKPDPKRQVPISRPNFVALCEQLVFEDEKRFEHLWRALGLSVDWTQAYTTIGARAQKVSQTAFLRNLERGEAYLQDAPTLWDVTFQTAVAQAELEARDYPGAYHRIAYHAPDGSPLHVETTRPELIVSAVALIAHPDDERYQGLLGTIATSPVFGVKIPVVAHPAAEMDKGSGLVMCCTFGDLTDVQWWREFDFPVRTVIGRDGRLLEETPGWLTTPAACAAYERLAGKTVFSAREAMVTLLRETGDLDGEPVPTHRVANFYEKGDKPLEIVSTRQWYIRNGGRDASLRRTMLELGTRLAWTPPHMQHRYENWVGGLNGDWLISRQRYFGVPFPIWYPLDAAGEPIYTRPIVPATENLPIDPSTDVPAGYEPNDRGEPNGFLGDPDVMDTWATSSLTPQIAGGWITDEDLFSRVFPMDLCTHAHDIIRTWLFSRMVRAHLEQGVLPWTRAMISGFVLAGTGKGKQGKISKSAANAKIDPEYLISTFGADAVRWRAAMSRPGLDSPFDEASIKVGRRFAMKVLNVGKFVLGNIGVTDVSIDQVSEPIDRALLSRLAEVVTRATDAFEAYDYTTALEVTESFFWAFCDDYVELVKERAYTAEDRAGARSARATLGVTLDVVLRLLAPFLPYVTEEVWSWWRPGSVHRAHWPQVDKLEAPRAVGSPIPDPETIDVVAQILSKLRGAKSQAQVSMRAELASVVVSGPDDRLRLAATAADDIKRAGRVIGSLVLTPGGDGEVSVRVEFAVTGD